jgi:hypothetical protein
MSCKISYFAEFSGKLNSLHHVYRAHEIKLGAVLVGNCLYKFVNSLTFHKSYKRYKGSRTPLFP